MAGNSFGKIFRLTTYGESHGAAIGGVIDGCPAGLMIDIDAVQNDLDRRRPGQSSITTPRNETDQVEFLSGIFEGKTLGSPIGFIIRNKDQKSEDYALLKDIFRPGHADEVWLKKFGHRDHRGGGRSSARETASRVVGGSIAKQILATTGIEITAWVSSVKDVFAESEISKLDLSQIEDNIVRCPDPVAARQMISLIEKTRDEKDSVGGTITCLCQHIPAGLGEPVFDKLVAALAQAMLSINATKGFEMCSSDGIVNGFTSTQLLGSENNTFKSGITGGISTGDHIVFRVAFKPTSTIGKKQDTKNVAGEDVVLEAAGRHDPCVLPRAVPIVEAMASLVLVDNWLMGRTSRL
ncbi:MAG: chorismate synthase [Flavobacteriales bacterium]|nr:chorismate synthase [Flavobacteriales bacterium]